MSDNIQNLDAMIDLALEHRREVAVPADFAGRVMRSLPPRPKRRSPVSVGRFITVFAAAVLLLIMFILAPQAHPNLANFAFDMELVMLAQLGGIAFLGMRSSKL